MAFNFLDIDIEFIGSGIQEKGIIKKCNNKKYSLEIGKEVIAIDKKYFRPTEVDILLGDPTKAKKKIGWEPKISFDKLVEEMVEKDLEFIKKNNAKSFNKK